MRRVYDIFEKLPDGSSKWRTFVSGDYETQCKLEDLAGRSENEFFAIDIQAGGLLPVNLARSNWRARVKNAEKQIA
jgi:hypothetical protein